MSVLYISDLDGTLLGPDQKIMKETWDRLNACIEKGINFTFATARTAASAIKIMDNIKVNVPCILMNGVCVYDIAARKYIRTEYIPSEVSAAVAEILHSLGQSGFMYKIAQGKLSCSYPEITNAAMEEFINKRRKRYGKPFTKIENFPQSVDRDVIYFALMDSFERLDRVRAEAEKIKGLKFEFYRDIYDPDYWYLEIFSDTASKYNGVRFLREKYGFREIIAFGDNLNDLPMFRAADRRVAVANADPKVIEAADETAAANTENGVALWIEEHIN